MAAPSETHGDNGDFSTSKLGTKEHWESTYNKEIENFRETGEEGEVWFGYGSVKRVVRWMERSADVKETSSVLDLGCGNGFTLLQLREKGFENLTGVDYVDSAVELAKALAEENGAGDIQYEQGDILEDPFTCSCLTRQYDVCHDKGTYDAICLNPDDPQEKRVRYRSSVKRLLSPGALFIITSCNWTEEELRAHFEAEGFSFEEKIPAPTFQFGGQTGNRETSLVFRRTVDSTS